MRTDNRHSRAQSKRRKKAKRLLGELLDHLDRQVQAKRLRLLKALSNTTTAGRF
jgi:hypothetical protein